MKKIYKVKIKSSVYENHAVCFLTQAVSITQKLLWSREVLGSQRLKVFWIHSQSLRNCEHILTVHFATKEADAWRDSSVQNTGIPSLLIKIIILRTLSTKYPIYTFHCTNMTTKQPFKITCKELDSTCGKVIAHVYYHSTENPWHSSLQSQNVQPKT